MIKSNQLSQLINTLLHGRHAVKKSFRLLGIDALTPLTISLTQPFMFANLFFLADHSRGVLDDTWRYRHLPAWPKAVQIYDHFRAFLLLPAKQQRADHLLVEIATIAGFLPSSSPIHTQGVFW